MTYNCKVKLQYINDTDANPSKYFPEIVDQQTITVEAPAQDLNTHQYFELFRSFLRAVGFAEYSIMDGAARVAFSDANDEAQMNKLMEEYDLQDKQSYTDTECREMEAEIRDLKAKLSRALNPDYPSYLPEEVEAMSAENEVTVDTLKNADVVCKDCGAKYGHYSVGCSSTWLGTCNVCGQERPVTESRDYGYLVKGIKELQK